MEIKRFIKLIPITAVIVAISIIPLICNFTSPHIISTNTLSFSINHIRQMIEKILYYLVYFYVLQMLHHYLVTYRYTCYLEAWDDFKKTALVLFVIRIIFDLVAMVLGGLSIIIEAYAEPILESLFWLTILVFLYLIYGKRYQRYTLKGYRKYIVSVLFITILLSIIVHFYQCINLIESINHIQSKYEIYDEQLLVDRVTFLSMLWNAFYSGLFALIINAYLLLISPQKTVCKKSEGRNKPVNSLSFLCWIMYVFALILLFYIISSQRITSVEFEKLNIEYNEEGTFDSGDSVVTVYAKNKSSDKRPIYNSTRVRLYYGDKCILNEQINGLVKKPYSLKYINNVEFKAIYCGYFAIAYEDGEDVKAFLLDEIQHINTKDEKLILIMKNLIQQGDFEYFAAGCSYLYKYDYDFIAPYIQRYQRGDFTEQEKEVNYNISDEYIIDFATGFGV